MSERSPLHGTRVLDLSQAISGPLVGRALADLGADVVRVEWPNGDVTNRFGPKRAGHTGLFAHMNAGKRGIAVDRSAPGATELLLRLGSCADVVIENFRPGVLDRAGLGYAELSAANPRLVMVSVSGFGRTSPESQRQAYAPVIHAESGLLARLAAAQGGPVADLAVSFADEIASLHAIVAVLAALNLRHRTGGGQHIDLSMLEAMVATDDHTSDAIDGNPTPADTRGSVWEAEGGPVMVAADPRTMWNRLSNRMGLQDPVGADADLATKIAARASAMGAWVASFTDRAELLRALEKADLAWADVRDDSTVFSSPSLAARQVVTQVDAHDGGTRGVVRMPYRFSDAESGVQGPAPQRGQHNREVLADWLGASQEDCAALVVAGVLI